MASHGGPIYVQFYVVVFLRHQTCVTFPTDNPPERDPLCAKQVAASLNQGHSYSNLSPITWGVWGNLWKLAHLRKSATRFAQSRSHLSEATPKKERDPLCTGQEAAKAANIVISPSAKQVALIWDPGAIGNVFGIEFY